MPVGQGFVGVPGQVAIAAGGRAEPLPIGQSRGRRRVIGLTVPRPIPPDPPMTWLELLSAYIADAASYWPAGSPLQARKLDHKVRQQCERLGVSPEQLVESVSSAAHRRSAAGTPTLFLINCGSSGSHWVEAMLASLPGIHACGEVYVAPGIGERLLGAGKSGRSGFLDALHQLHMESPARARDDDILINSAHSWNPHDLMGEPARPVLLLRDPVDVVVSRTFRKPKLRRHVAPVADDRAYLEKNASMVEKFYRSALRRKPSTIIRYENLLARPEVELARLLAAVGRSAPSHRLREVASGHSRQAQQASGQRLSNVYRGPATVIPPELLDEASDRLARLRADLGYA